MYSTHAPYSMLQVATGHSDEQTQHRTNIWTVSSLESMQRSVYYPFGYEDTKCNIVSTCQRGILDFCNSQHTDFHFVGIGDRRRGIVLHGNFARSKFQYYSKAFRLTNPYATPAYNNDMTLISNTTQEKNHFDIDKYLQGIIKSEVNLISTRCYDYVNIVSLPSNDYRTIT